MRVAIVGSRTYRDLASVREFVRNLPPQTVIVSECAAEEGDVIITYSEGVVTMWASHGRTDARTLTLTPAEIAFLMLDRCA